MARRSLVVGSETGLLSGVDRDAREMAEYLADAGFAVDLRTGPAATRAGILAGWAELTADAQPDDAVVVYYSGHGSLEVIPEAPAASGPFARRRYQAIVPFDYADSAADDYRGILAEELAIALFKLTERAANVAVILDCCHAARMVRGPAVVKALPHPLHVGVERCIAAVLASEPALALASAFTVQGSDAVRLLACRQEQSAYEYVGTGGLTRGVFTDGLLTALRGAPPVTWRELGERASEYARQRFPRQLPGFEGRVDRRLFSLAEAPRGEAVVIVDSVEEGWVVRRGRVSGVRVGDVYSLRPADADAELGRARVTAVGSVTARVALTLPPGAALPDSARAVPIEHAGPPHRVHVPIDCEQRDRVVAAIADPRRLVVDQPDALAIAAVTVQGGALSLANGEGLPMLAPAPLTATALARLASQLTAMARARALRELHGDDAAPDDLRFEWGLVVDGLPTPLPPQGAAVGPGDGLHIRLKNDGPRALHVHVLAIDVSDRVTLLTGPLAPSGVRLEPGGEQLLPRHPLTGALAPIAFAWPATVPTAPGERGEQLVCLALREPVDLSHLAQPGVNDSAASAAPTSHRLTRGTTRTTRGSRSDCLRIRRIQYSASPWPVHR